MQPFPVSFQRGAQFRVAAPGQSLAAEDHDVERVLLALHLADRIGMNVPHRVWDMRPLLLDALEQVQPSGEGGRA